MWPAFCIWEQPKPNITTEDAEARRLRGEILWDKTKSNSKNAGHRRMLEGTEKS